MTTQPPQSDGDAEHARAWDAIVADLSNDPDFVAQLDSRRGLPSGSYELGADRHDDEDDGYEPSPWERYLDEGYEPPEPEPITMPSDPVLRFAWLGVIGGPLVVIGSNVVGGSTMIGGLGVAAFLAGFVVLVGRMRDRRDDDDSGAIV